MAICFIFIASSCDSDNASSAITSSKNYSSLIVNTDNESSEISSSSQHTSSRTPSNETTSSKKPSNNNVSASLNSSTPHTHNFIPATCTKPKTCTSCGATEGDILAHSFSKADCTNTAKCTVCGFDSQKNGEHLFKNYFCTICNSVDENVITIKTPNPPSAYHITSKSDVGWDGISYYKNDKDYTVLNINYWFSPSGHPDKPFNLFVTVTFSAGKYIRQPIDYNDNPKGDSWELDSIIVLNSYIRVRHESGTCEFTSPATKHNKGITINCGTTGETTYRFEYLEPGEHTIEFFNGIDSDGSDDTFLDWYKGM